LHYPGVAKESVADKLGMCSSARGTDLLSFAALTPIC